MIKRASLVTVTAIAAFGVLWACGGGNDDGDDDGVIDYEAGVDAKIIFDTGFDAPDPATGQGQQLCDATLGLIAKAVTSCCTPAETSGLPLDLYKNIATYQTNCGQTLENSIAARRLTINQQAFDACINGYNAIFSATADSGVGQCGGLDEFRAYDVLSTSCSQIFAGKGVANDKCNGSYDCNGSLVCIGYTATTEGTCQAAAPADGNCGLGATPGVPAVDLVIPPINTCSGGFYCDVNNQCKKQLDNDATCTTSAQCSGGSCLMGHCDDARDGTPKSPNADGCIASSDCKTGSYCDIPGNAAGLKSDGGAPDYATGTCAPSQNNVADCDGGAEHQCLGKCQSGGHCGTSCSFPN